MQISFQAALESFYRELQGFVQQIPNIFVGILIFFLFWLIARLVRATIRRVNEQLGRHGVGLVLGRLAQATITFIGVLTALVIAIPGFKPGQLVQVLGLSTVAIGFAFQDIFKNFLAGILLLIAQPFRIGDQIVVGDFEGTVEDIQTRATFLKTYDGRRVVIPNAELFSDSVIVNTAFETRRLQYDFGIGYGDDVENAKRVALEAVRSVDAVIAEPAPDVLVVALGDSTVNLRVRWWVKPPRRADALEVQDQVLTVLKNRLTAEGIDLPFPTQQVLFHDQTEETDGDRRRQREGWPIPKNGDAPRPQAQINAAAAAAAEATAATAADNSAAPDAQPQ